MAGGFGTADAGGAGGTGGAEAGRAATGTGAAGAATAQQVGSQAPTGAAAASGQQATASPGRGLREPSWAEIRAHVPAELTTAAQRTATTTRADVAGAMHALTPAARQGVIGLRNLPSGEIRGRMAQE